MNPRPRSLVDIEAAWESLPDGDIEAAHTDADELLCEALLFAAKMTGRNSYRLQAERIVERFRVMPKWYA